MNGIPTFADIKKAADRINPFIFRTPLLTNASINRLLDTDIYFKCENFQKVGAFKYRGAINAVLSLTEKEAQKGVATHSSGNHAAALTLAAHQRGIKAYIVMPRSAPAVKIKAVEEYGAEIIFCEPTLRAREENLEKVISQTRATFIHPYNDYRIICGQATACLEMLDDKKNLDMIISPVGGGGLLSGTALCVAYYSPDTIVFGAEPEGADDAFKSMQQGKIIPSVSPKTIADGLLTSLGTLTFPIIMRYVKRIVTTSDQDIVKAMRFIWERMKIIVEPSAAVSLAILISNKNIARNKKVGIILSGGNIDLDNLPW